MKYRYFKMINKSEDIEYWKWIKGKGVYIKYTNDAEVYKSSYTLKDLLKNKYIKEIPL